MIRLIVSDVDGTLLDDDGEMNSKTKEMIIKARKEGVKFLICSGRSEFEIQLIFEDIGFRTEAICLNGADLIGINGTHIKTYFLSSDVIENCAIFASENHYIVEFHCQHKTYLTCSKNDLYQKYYQYEKTHGILNEDQLKTKFSKLWYYKDECYNKTLD